MTAVTAMLAKHLAWALRAGAPMLIATACLWILGRQVDGLDPGAMRDSLSDIAPHTWAGAAIATAISFWAVGHQEAIAHRHLGTGVAPGQALRSGMAAVALSQTLGFGLATGSFARWRLVPGLWPLSALSLTTFVALAFMAALLALAMLACLLLRPTPALAWAGGVGLVLGGAAVTLALAMPRHGGWRRAIRLPTIPAVLAIVTWATIDTAAAATALYLLLPATVDQGFAIVLTAYLVALVAALASGSPGGVGSFDLALMTLLPMIAPDALVSTLVAFRLIYFAGPAILAALFLLAPGRADANLAIRAPRLRALPQDRRRSETGVIRQNGGFVLRAPGLAMAIVETPQTCTALFDPLYGDPRLAPGLLIANARASNRVPCLYKCDGRTALAARGAGWAVRRIAREAVLDPMTFSTDAPAQRQLRRKLRNADRAGLSIRCRPVSPPLADLARIDLAWQRTHGAAHGTTMGRYSPDYIAWQRVYVAELDGVPCGFVTFHAARREWCLDLVRQTPEAPDGTIHALILAALDEARQAGLRRLSLACVPEDPRSGRPDPGLARFKSLFSPAWEPRYMAAPGWPTLALAAADLVAAVHAPPALDALYCRPAHEDDEQNEFATPRPA